MVRALVQDAESRPLLLRDQAIGRNGRSTTSNSFWLTIPLLFDSSQEKGYNVTTRALTGTALALFLVACGSSSTSKDGGGTSSKDGDSTSSIDSATSSIDGGTSSIDSATCSIAGGTSSSDRATGNIDGGTSSIDSATGNIDGGRSSIDSATGSIDGGSTPIGGCPDLSGVYNVTTEIVSTTCPLGLHVITQPIAWTFVQTAPSCDFTMTNSLYPTSHYAGQFSMVGTQAKVIWTTSTPAPIVSGYALTYAAENLTIAPAVPPAAAKLSGSFDWSSAYPCTGTTNVCSGSVASGCLTPN